MSLNDLGPVSRKARKLFGSEGKFFKLKPVESVAQFLTNKPFNFAFLTDSFIVSFSKLLKFTRLLLL